MSQGQWVQTVQHPQEREEWLRDPIAQQEYQQYLDQLNEGAENASDREVRQRTQEQ
jgi:predicted glycosyl hydrolase (DUF1957 family)